MAETLQLPDPYQRAMSVIERWKAHVGQASYPADLAAAKLGFALMEALDLAYHAGVEDALKAVQTQP